MTESCNFCGKGQHDVGKIIVGEDAGICDKCVALCSTILASDARTSGNTVDINPMELKVHLDKFIVSQDAAKITLSVAVANHFKRINSAEDIVEKSNVLLLGPTGSGKTLLAKTIAEYLDLPFVIVDATRMTEAGYAGEDVESILTQLVQKANGDVIKAQRGIVFIDEIDKIAKRATNFSGKEVGGEGVQQALLKMVEGSPFTIALKSSETSIEIDTSNILFIASGAFIGLDTIKKKKNTATHIGFSADVKNRLKVETDFADLINYGMIPEFAGRFPVLAEVNELSPRDMLNILSTVENNLVTQYKHLFNYNNVDLAFEELALEKIVNIAIVKKTGARGLRAIMEKALLPHMFNIQKYIDNDINKVSITESLITNPTEFKKHNA